MILRILLFSITLFLPFTAYAENRFILNFDLEYADGRSEKGRTVSYKKPVTWSNGLIKSYLTLTCREKSTGKYERLYSTVDYFSGVRVTHKIKGKHLEIEVFRQTVTPRLEEIRGLSRKKCREMLPIVNTVTETYSFPANDGLDEARTFGTYMTFRVKLMALDR